MARKGGVPLDRAGSTAAGPYRFLENYPASGLVFEEPIEFGEVWSCIDKLQQQDIPLNLIYSHRHLYLFARNVEHEMIEEFPGGVMACMELSGRLITTEEKFYRDADTNLLNSAFRKVTLGREALLRVLG